MREIGSEFWKKSGSDICNEDSDAVYVLSGRTALDFIIRDIKCVKNISSAALPSYCCESMVEPFLRNGVNVSFYTVSENTVEQPAGNYDTILVLDYFGFHDSNIHRIGKQAKADGKTVIYDATHFPGFFPEYADYSFCSYRKWEYCNYAVVNKNGRFNLPKPVRMNKRYITLRNEAAELKNSYVNAGYNGKKTFLEKYTEAEELLGHDYQDYSGIYTRIDYDSIISDRRENAGYLIEKMKKIPNIRLWKTELNQGDCPLFVPVLVSSEIRDEFRKYMISQSIYCPVHWPRTSVNIGKCDLYDREISLICDQRYNIDDMDRQINAVRKYFDRG